MLKKFINTIEEAKQALLGTILADGSIGKQRTNGSRNGTNASLEITHTSKNLDYLKEVKELLEIIPGIKCDIRERVKKTPLKNYTMYRLTTNRHQWFTTLREQLYTKNRIKLFTKEIIDSLSEISLFLMYLDDGTLRVRYKENSVKLREARITLCLDSFTYEELLYFQKWLLETYSIKTGIYRHTKTLPLNRGFRIWTNTENTKKLMTLFDKYYESVPSMKYKFLKYYSL